MNLLKILKENILPNESAAKIEVLEESFGFELPSLIKSFYKIYDVSVFSEYSPYLFYNSEHDVELPFYSVRFEPNEDYQIENFFKIDEIFEKAQSVYSAKHEFWNKKMIPIAECFDQGYLLVNCSEVGLCQLFMDYGHKDEMEFVSENIFEYCSNNKITFEPNDLPEGKELKDLYKNWDEDFWRIKE